MAMTMEGAFTVPADKQAVWDALNDPVVLKNCISGIHTLDKTSATNFAATARMKIGPLSASFKGRFRLENVDAPNGCRIVGEGEGGIAGFARGAANVRLADGPEGTTVAYDVEANVGGKLAHVGGRLIDGVAKRIVDQFFMAFAAVVSRQETTVE